MGDRVILHSDINCCYASIEHLHHPELAGKPLAVGGAPEARHGIVLTADYIAKKYGVKTGMALWQAKVRLCKLINRETNLLILDGPTNHLDVDAKEELKRALKDYHGSILLVCHESEFYSDIVTKVWNLEEYSVLTI